MTGADLVIGGATEGVGAPSWCGGGGQRLLLGPSYGLVQAHGEAG